MDGVVLHPLAEVGIGMFVAIVIGARELVVDFESHRERRHAEQHTGKEQRDQATGPGMGGGRRTAIILITPVSLYPIP